MNMERAHDTSAAKAVEDRLLYTVHVRTGTSDVGTVLPSGLGGSEWGHVFVFSPDEATLRAVTDAACAVVDCPVTGCTTAGQIGKQGYADTDTSVVIAMPAGRFATRTVRIDDLDSIDDGALADKLVQARTALMAQHPDKPNGFGFLMVDGLSLREDVLAATIAPSLGAWPIFGGSAGDGDRFEHTFLSHDGALHEGVAVITFVATDCETRVFSLNHLEPTERRMIVTKADPHRRVVKEINAEPAAREYARMVGKDPAQLDEFTFSANPVVVRLGDTHHVRAIQRVTPEGELVFFSAIEEGMVLNVAEPKDIAQHLNAELTKLKAGQEAVEIFACDCLLRKIEAEQTQATRAMSNVLTRNRVVGFSTYGEQIGPLHVNHTMTGVMLVAPG